MKEQIISELNFFLKENLSDEFIGLIFISNFDSVKNDIDFILLLNDKADKLETVSKYSSFAVNMTRKYKIFLSIYPVFESDLLEPENMFLQNVKTNTIYV